jgi:hydrogenase-4 transcriptional activator
MYEFNPMVPASTALFDIADSSDLQSREPAKPRLSSELVLVKGKLGSERNGETEKALNVHPPHGIVGRSAVLRFVLEQVEMVAPTDATALILGETGTGKELIASAIHAHSPRRDGPFVRVNCGSIPSELFESEFFGHAKGSFTGAVRDRIGRFQHADGGTLFLDEVGEIPMAHQAKLLRVLQEGQFERVGEDTTRKVDVRIVAATNRDLRQEVAEGRFREDLYYRLSVFPMQLPPLRERREDIAALAAHFAARSCERLNRPDMRLTDDDIRMLQRYDWPGNIRQLQNVIERAVILAKGPRLRLDLAFAYVGSAHSSVAATAKVAKEDGALAKIIRSDDLSKLERENIFAALEFARWKISGPGGAARILDMNPSTLASRMRTLGIRRSRTE